jgi:subtilisin family serine protease
MRRVLSLLFAFTFGVLGFAMQGAHSQTPSRGSAEKFRRVQKPVLNSYIVVLKEAAPGVDTAAVAAELAGRHGGNVKHVYQHALKGFAVELPEAAAEALSRNPRVEYVEEDGEMSFTQFEVQPNLDRINQRDLPRDFNTGGSNGGGDGVHIYVIDSGINSGHAEFFGHASVAADFVGEGGYGFDCTGHGTHVAGIIGAGHYGVAPMASIHAVRINGCSETFAASTVITGVDWVTANHLSPAVVNMSLGGAPNTSLDTAVRNSIASGLTYVIAAGNDSQDYRNVSPARVGEAITVGAVDNSDVRASFSNFGPSLDILAPGVGIKSTWIGSSTATNILSGTSQAAPHVAGVAARFLQSNPTASPDLVAGAIRKASTKGRLSNLGTGTPNRLLYSIINSSYGGDIPGWLPLYRYYSDASTDHFYTTDWSGSTINGGYQFEWIEGYVRQSPLNQTPGSSTLYRYYSGTSLDHFYTTDFNEMGNGNFGWGFERIEGYIDGSRGSTCVPNSALHRYWSAAATDHMYTTNPDEFRDGSHGYAFEYVEGCLLPAGD